MSRLLSFSLGLLGIVLVPTALRAFEDAEPAPVPIESEAVQIPAPDLEDSFQDGLMPPGWTFVGCIFLGSGCKDVFIDSAGTYWVCKACGTTNNPGPGKCRKLTAYELQNALWCS
jgi:hypothetical protein